MSNEPASASMSFDVRFMRKGKHSIFLHLPEDYHAPIGLVVAYWGSFETIFDAMLSALIEGEQADGVDRDAGNWRRKSFKHRRKLLKDVCTRWLSTWDSTAAEKIKTIADTAGDISRKRNLIAHGTYSYTVLARSSSAVSCRAINHKTGDELMFDLDVLKKLYHDISHLAADLLIAFQSLGEVHSSFVTIPDEEILRLYRETEHPWNPNPKKRTSPSSA